MSPDQNPIEMLWQDPKKAAHARKPSNVTELQQFCKDERANIPPQRCQRLIASYCERLIAVVAALLLFLLAQPVIRLPVITFCTQAHAGLDFFPINNKHLNLETAFCVFFI